MGNLKKPDKAKPFAWGLKSKRGTFMAKNSLVFLAVVALVLLVQPVRADVLYSSGLAWNATTGQYGISGTGSYVTDPFTLSASTITSIDLGLWDAFDASNHYDPSALTYTIQDATGAVLSSGTVGLTTLNSQSYGSGFWEFESEFSLNVNLSAGTYYLTLANGLATNGEAIGWSFSQSNNNLTAWSSRDFTTSAPNVSAESFIINGTTSPVPLPPALLLLGSGLIGLVGTGKRFKKA